MTIRHGVSLAAALALTLPLGAQMGMGPRVPTLGGVWRPVVGSGATYERASKQDGSKGQIEVTVLGKEDMGGKTGYWSEITFTDPKMGHEMIIKELMAVTDDGVAATKTIMQMPGQDPMEMDANMSGNMAGHRMQHSNPADFRSKAELVGTETITVPAGTFACEHYRAKDGSDEAWISDKVSPWSLVKSQNKDTTIVLTKIITDAKDHITGTPKKFDPMEMMRKGMGQQGQ